MRLKVRIGRDGTVRFIYHDALRGLLALGTAEIRRASHVEPVGTHWSADMTPVGGPVLGTFPTRQAALDAEVQWLEQHRLGAQT